MNPRNQLTVPKWPFFVADGVFVACAGLVFWFAGDSAGPATGAIVVLLLLLGAVVGLVPYFVECYWNWQQTLTEREEKIEQQRQALVKTGEAISEVVREWEQVAHREPEPASPSNVINRQIEEATQGLQQWQARLEETEAALSRGIEKVCGENAKRGSDGERFEQIAAQLTMLTEKLDSAVSGIESAPGGTSIIPGDAPIPPARLPSERISAKRSQAAVIETEAPAVEDNGETPPPPVPAKGRKSAKPKVRQESGAALFSTTTLVATAFIGASNKLFLRGEGPGLTWEEGVPMQFVEIGKWSWTTTEASGPIRLRVMKNDEEEDKAGVLILEPGQTLEVRPDFDG